MLETYGLKRDVLDKITSVFNQYSKSIEQVILFGSRARGDYKSTSDIDLAIKFKNDKHKLFEVINGLDELDVIYTFDVIDYAEVVNQHLKDDIDREGIVIF